VIITEQNRNNSSFDETRAFTAPVNGEKRAPRPAPNTADRSAAVRDPANIQRRPVQSRPNTQANGNTSGRPPVESNQQRPIPQNRSTTQAQRPRPVQNRDANAIHPRDAGSVQPLNHASPAPVSRNSNLQSVPRPIQRPKPQQNQQSQQRQNVNPSAAQLKTPEGRNNIPDSAQSTKQISPEVSRQMMKTRTTNVADLRIKEKPKDEEKSSGGSGEGGNTIISLVKAIVYIVFVCVVSVFLAVTIVLVGNDIFAFVKSDEVVEVTLPENTTLDDLAEILHENGVIEYPSVFKLYAVAKHDDQKYVAGTYTVTPMMNYSFLLAEFKEKIDYGTVRITIPEGYTTDEIIDLFVAEGIGTREGFIDVIENGEFDYWFIDELEANGISEDRIYRLDGYLFPDTYDFYKNSSEKTVINKLLRRFSQMFKKDYREQCEKMGYTVDEMVTLASIIEKEAANMTEFLKVSSVFHNRLNNPWNFPKLESDATVVYVIEHETGERTVDLNYETPYNTYKYDGLTPGPIANPSASAILAALSPQETNYFFFYSHEGVTYFSETKAQHDAYIEQFKNQDAGRIPANIPEN